MKSKAVRQLEKEMTEAKKKNSTLPDYAVVSVKLKTGSSNDLTSSIEKYLNYLPKCKAYRVNNVGIYDKKIGGYRKSNTIKGIADIDCTYKGFSIKIEVKFGKDRMSEHQKKYKKDIEDALGIYIIAKTFDQFYEDFLKVKVRIDNLF